MLALLAKNSFIESSWTSQAATPITWRDPLPSTGARPWSLLPSIATIRRFSSAARRGKPTRGSQNLLYCIPLISFLKQDPLGYAACSEGLKKGIVFPFHMQDVRIDSLRFEYRFFANTRPKATCK